MLVTREDKNLGKRCVIFRPAEPNIAQQKIEVVACLKWRRLEHSCGIIPATVLLRSVLLLPYIEELTMKHERLLLIGMGIITLLGAGASFTYIVMLLKGVAPF